jgi:hypothetical protein
LASRNAAHASGQIGAALSLANAYRSKDAVISPVLLRELVRQINKAKRLPDSSEPWASEICQANLVAFTLRKCVQQLHLSFEDGQRDECVSPPFFRLKNSAD